MPISKNWKKSYSLYCVERIASLYASVYTCHLSGRYDISLPLLQFYKVVEDLGPTLGPAVVNISGAGHIGDGNIHFSVTSKEFSQVNTNVIVEKHQWESYYWCSPFQILFPSEK